MNGWVWADARGVAYDMYLSWGWLPSEAAWAAYYGKPFTAVLVGAR